MSNEYELKFLNIEKQDFRDKLELHGFSCKREEFLMKRKTYNPADDYKHPHAWGRVRDEGTKITATIKWYEVPDNPSISEVHENEIIVDKWEDGDEWLLEKGFTVKAYQENTREIWVSNDNDAEVTIDVWPGLKPYTEIEAPSQNEVEAIATMLGFNIEEGFAGGTEIIYRNELDIDILKLSEITFNNPPKK